MKKSFFVVIVLLFVAGCSSAGQVKKEQRSAAVGNIQTANIQIDVPFEAAVIRPLASDSSNLIEANVEYIGDLTFNVSGSTVTLMENTNGLNYEGDPLKWDVALNPSVPTSLTLNVSSGQIDADLSGLTLTQLGLTAGSGKITVNFPVNSGTVPVNISNSSGEITVNVPDNARFDLQSLGVTSGLVTLNIGSGVTFTSTVVVSSGEAVLDLPDDAPVQVAASSVSSGDVIVPESFIKTEGAEDSEEGMYVSPAGQDAENPITLDLSITSGKVTIR